MIAFLGRMDTGQMLSGVWLVADQTCRETGIRMSVVGSG